MYRDGAPLYGGGPVDMNLSFCPSCRRAAPDGEICLSCGLPCTADAQDYTEMLLQTILSEETNRAGMAVDVLTKWVHEPRAFVPLTMLLERNSDPFPLVLGARGLGWLGNPEAAPVLSFLLLDEAKPYVARVAAAEALGSIGGEFAHHALKQAKGSPRSSVADAAMRALKVIEGTPKIAVDHD